MLDPYDTLTRRRRPSLAYTVAERDAWLRGAYLERYEDDREFGRELLAVYAEHAVPLAPLPFDPTVWWMGAASEREDVRQLWGITDPGPILAYREAARALGRRCGLDRLRPPGHWLFPGLEVGEYLVHAWCWWRAIQAADGRDFGPEHFAAGYGVAESVPNLKGGAWDPRHETYAAARARLGWRRARDLRAIAEKAEAGGLEFLDSRPELHRDLGWLYRHVVGREPFAAIVAADLGDDPDVTKEKTVRTAVGAHGAASLPVWFLRGDSK